MRGQRQGRRRSAAEWVTFALSAAVVAAVVGLIAVEIPPSRRPPMPVATQGVSVARGDVFVVPVRVENRGERTAQDVQVQVTLTMIGGEEHEGDQVVDFLSGGELEEMEFLFDDDPDAGEVEVRVTGYTVP